MLSSATAIVGTAGSSFAAEAARIGDVKWYTQRDWGLFNQLNAALRVPGGECDIVPPAIAAGGKYSPELSRQGKCFDSARQESCGLPRQLPKKLSRCRFVGIQVFNSP